MSLERMQSMGGRREVIRVVLRGKARVMRGRGQRAGVTTCCSLMVPRGSDGHMGRVAKWSGQWRCVEVERRGSRRVKVGGNDERKTRAHCCSSNIDLQDIALRRGAKNGFK